MSSFDDLLVAHELRKYVMAHGQRDADNRCWKINSGPHGWGQFFESNPHLKDANRKPKRFCESYSTTLCWLSDDSAPGKGYITVPEVAHSTAKKGVASTTASTYELHKPSSSMVDDTLVALELRKYITTHGQKDPDNRCLKINAGPHGWGQFFECNPHLKDANRKPKRFCESYSTTLCWLSDDSAPGKGYITVPEVAHSTAKKGVASATASTHDLHKPSSSMIAVSSTSDSRGPLANICRSMNSVTVTTDHKSKTTHIIGKTPSKSEIVGLEKKVRPNFDVVFVIDVSGSMAGAQSKQTFQAISDIIINMQPSDGFGIIKFNDDAECILPLTKNYNISFPDCIAAHLTNDKQQFKCSGTTKLWDSSLLGMDLLMKRTQGSSHPKPSHPHLVIITDGEDNRSREHTKDTIKKILQCPGDYAKEHDKDGKTFAHFHCSLISVGIKESVQYKEFEDITKDKSNLHHFHADGAAEIASCFKEVTTKVMMLKETHVEVTITAKTVENFSKIPSSSAPRAKK